MNTKGFTLMEVIIACAVLSLFMAGVISLYSSGSKISNTTMWLQNVTNQLKNASRHINTSIKNSSYPSKVEFPNKIIESRDGIFRLKYKNGELKASDAGKFLESIECTPARARGNNSFNRDATIVHHEYFLNQNGNLVYTRTSQDVNASDINENYNNLPNGNSESTVLVRDVESVTCERRGGENAMQVTIKCSMPKHPATTREETTIGISNVEIDATL